MFKTMRFFLNFVSANKVLFLILLLASVLRLVGVYPGFHPYHSDEGMSYSSAIEMIRNTNLDPTRYDYPSLVPLINMLIYVLILIPLFILKNSLVSPEDLPTKGRNLVELFQQVAIANQQTVVLFWGRFITALFGIGVVILVYLVAKKFFDDKRIALTASFLTAVNFRQVLNSHLGLPDIYNAFFLLVSFLSLAYLLKNPIRKNYIFAAIAVALYFSVKFQVFILPAFILTHLYILFNKIKKRKIGKLIFNSFNLNFAIALLIIPVIVLLISPYHLLHWDKFVGVNAYTALKYQIGVKVFNFYPLYYLYNIGIGQFISIAAVIGIFVSLIQYKFKSLMLLSVILPFFFIFVYYTGGGYYVRNFVTITPLLMIFAAIFVVRFWDYFGKKIKLHKSLVVIFLLATVVSMSFNQLKNSIISSYNFSKPWGFAQAHDWAEVNIPDSSKIVSHPWDKYPRDKNLEVIPFEQSEIFGLPEMIDAGADFGFLNTDWLTLSSYWWMNMKLPKFVQFGGKPNAILANTYSAVSSMELSRYAVAKFVRPWQAPDMNFLIVKIPRFPTIGDNEKKLKEYFAFDNSDQFNAWHVIMGPGDTRKINFDSDIGKSKPGSLNIGAGVPRFPITMVTSPAIPVEGGKAFNISGWIKIAEEIDKKSRDGFLRVDFYKEEPKVDLNNQSLQSSVSSRVFGKPGWYEKEMLVFAPEEANFMTVSMQLDNYNQFWIDDIRVYEVTKEIENPRRKPPYIDYKFPDDILFPYSQGNL